MSQGLVCLTCRKYVAEQADRENRWTCRCSPPRPSWNLRTDAPRETLTQYVLDRIPAPGGEGREP